MAQSVKKLSVVLVNTLSLPGYYGDGGGLWLRISRSGSKSWVLRFTLAGRRREMGLGALHTISLAMAREKALECRRMLDDGQDQIVARTATRTKEALSLARVKTFDQCAAAYIKAHRGGWKSAKHAAQWETSLANYASPVFGALPVSEVDTDLVVKALRPIWGHQDRDGGAVAWPDRKHPRLGNGQQISCWRKSGQVARSPGEPAGKSEQDRAGYQFPGLAMARDCPVHG
jgi:hypothetical protein